MSRRFQFSLRDLLVIACIAGMVLGTILVPLVVDAIPIVLDVHAGRAVPRPALFARLHATGVRTAAIAFTAAGIAALFFAVKLWRLQGRPSKK